MPPVKVILVGELKPLTGKGSRAINKTLREEILPIVINQVTLDIADKARDYARGIDLPPKDTVINQATHTIGSSESGKPSEGKLANSIKTSYFSKIKSLIEATAEYASWVEFGTGIWGPKRRPIKKDHPMTFPTKDGWVSTYETQGQPPQPFMRGATYYIRDNLKDTIERINKKIRTRNK